MLTNSQKQNLAQLNAVGSLKPSHLPHRKDDGSFYFPVVITDILSDIKSTYRTVISKFNILLNKRNNQMGEVEKIKDLQKQIAERTKKKLGLSSIELEQLNFELMDSIEELSNQITKAEVKLEEFIETHLSIFPKVNEHYQSYLKKNNKNNPVKFSTENKLITLFKWIGIKFIEHGIKFKEHWVKVLLFVIYDVLGLLVILQRTTQYDVNEMLIRFAASILTAIMLLYIGISYLNKKNMLNLVVLIASMLTYAVSLLEPMLIEIYTPNANVNIGNSLSLDPSEQTTASVQKSLVEVVFHNIPVIITVSNVMFLAIISFLGGSHKKEESNVNQNEEEFQDVLDPTIHSELNKHISRIQELKLERKKKEQNKRLVIDLVENFSKKLENIYNENELLNNSFREIENEIKEIKNLLIHRINAIYEYLPNIEKPTQEDLYNFLNN